MFVLVAVITITASFVLIIINFKIKDAKVVKALETTGILDSLGESTGDMRKNAQAVRLWLQRMEAKHGPIEPVEQATFTKNIYTEPSYHLLPGNITFDHKSI